MDEFELRTVGVPIAIGSFLNVDRGVSSAVLLPSMQGARHSQSLESEELKQKGLAAISAYAEASARSERCSCRLRFTTTCGTANGRGIQMQVRRSKGISFRIRTRLTPDVCSRSEALRGFEPVPAN